MVAASARAWEGQCSPRAIRSNDPNLEVPNQVFDHRINGCLTVECNLPSPCPFKAHCRDKPRGSKVTYIRSQFPPLDSHVFCQIVAMLARNALTLRGLSCTTTPTPPARFLWHARSFHRSAAIHQAPIAQQVGPAGSSKKMVSVSPALLATYTNAGPLVPSPRAEVNVSYRAFWLLTCTFQPPTFSTAALDTPRPH